MIAECMLWGRRIGAVSLEAKETVARFQYDPDFASSGIQLSPLVMPLSNRVFQFPELPRPAFHGLPGLLADSLPDKFGNAILDAWLAAQGRSPASFTAVDRLCYIGKRGMGALEFEPQQGPKLGPSTKLEIDALVSLASDILSQRESAQASFDTDEDDSALADILRVGTSAGGARAKAVIAWNPDTDEVRSGQVETRQGFTYWLLKLDGVSGNKDKELEDPKGYGAIEFAYSLMAKRAGIQMSECRLLEEGGRRHFMTRRFDRLEGGEKLHMQSLAALRHFDFNSAGAYSYEQALHTIRKLGLPMSAVEEQFRRMLFNVVARNQDDHVKNIAFLMDKQGNWTLSPGFDITFSYNPAGLWTSNHQMTINGKRDGFTLRDFQACAKSVSMKRTRASQILEEVVTAVKDWPTCAAEAGVRENWSQRITKAHRVSISSS